MKKTTQLIELIKNKYYTKIDNNNYPLIQKHYSKNKTIYFKTIIPYCGNYNIAIYRCLLQLRKDAINKAITKKDILSLDEYIKILKNQDNDSIKQLKKIKTKINNNEK